MRIFLIAGEPSGDKLGGAMMRGLRTLVPDVAFDGIGGEEMTSAGLTSQFPMDELSVMGLAEVLPKYRHLVRRKDQTVERILADPPELIVTIDSPDFCLRVLKDVRAKAQIPTAHYVAPTVWAWRAKRVQRMVGLVDQVLALFPFEPPYMQAAGIASDFVGHPVVAEPAATAADVQALRLAFDLGDAPILLVLPGSRAGELGRLAPIFGEALRPVLKKRQDLRVIVPAAAPVASKVIDAVKTWPGDPVVLDPRGTLDEVAGQQKRAAFKAADIALAASGTVSLELAAAHTPMVIAYDFNWISRQIIKAMLKVDTVTLVNLVSETRAVPEFLGAECKPAAIAGGILNVLEAPEVQSEALNVTMDRLGRGGEDPGLRAARAVLEHLKG